ncbi:MAG: HPr family phosphocarrier protein [Chloroflexota bacterium]
MITRDVVFRDRYGLHPRSAHRILETLSGVASRVTIESVADPGSPIDARSMLALISSSIRTGDRVRITAEGQDEEAVAASLGDLLEAGVCHP